VRKDHVGLQADQFFREHSLAFNDRGTPPNIHMHIAAIGPTQLLKRSRETGNPEQSFGIVFAEPHEHADAPHPLALLRARRQRPSRRRAAEKRNELTPLHVAFPVS
jgi:hypothetical protein